MPVQILTDEEEFVARKRAAIHSCSNPDDTDDTAVLPVGFEDSDEAQAIPDGCEPCHGLPGAYAQVPLCSGCGRAKVRRTYKGKPQGWVCHRCHNERNRSGTRLTPPPSMDDTIPCIYGTEIPRPTSSHNPVYFCSDACRYEETWDCTSRIVKAAMELTQ